MSTTSERNEPQIVESQALQTGFADDTMHVVPFKVSDEIYGIDIRLVREIRIWSATTRLPNTPAFVRGVINLRSSIVPILDLRARFGQGQTQPSTAHVIVVVEVGTRVVGILVDSAMDIVTLRKSDIKAMPAVKGSGTSAYLYGLVIVNEQMIALLAVDRVAGVPTIQ
jgi:purine-binding chemotaxis protein CheW